LKCSTWKIKAKQVAGQTKMVTFQQYYIIKLIKALLGGWINNWKWWTTNWTRSISVISHCNQTRLEIQNLIQILMMLRILTTQKMTIIIL